MDINLDKENKDSKLVDEKDKVTRRKLIIDATKDAQLTRRMIATVIGYQDQTFMVTQSVKDLIKEDRLFETTKALCKRSNKKAMYLTSDIDKKN
jgi:phage terminase large subunit-like protein